MERRHLRETPPQTQESEGVRLPRTALQTVELRQQSLSDESARAMDNLAPDASFAIAEPSMLSPDERLQHLRGAITALERQIGALSEEVTKDRRRLGRRAEKTHLVWLLPS